MSVVEHARSGRSSCRGCGNKIEKGALRIGKETDWGSFSWYHPGCVVTSTQPSDLAGYTSLSASDQAQLNSQMRSAQSKPNKKKAKTAPAPAAPGFSFAGAFGVAFGGGAASGWAASSSSASASAQPGGGFDMTALNDEQGLSVVEYAKAKKPSDCKECKGKIRNGEIRVGDKAPSPFYEGLQTRWVCWKCALKSPRLRRVTQLQGWDRIGYDACRELREKTKELFSAEREAELRQSMEAVEVLQEMLCENLTVGKLIEILRMNGMDDVQLNLTSGTTTNTIDTSVIISDGIANGLPDNCPVCASQSLVECHGRLVCWGYIEGITKCVYKGRPESVQRFRFKMPDDVLQADWLRDWRKQNHAAKLALARGDPVPKCRKFEPAEEETAGAGSGTGKGKGKTKKELAQEAADAVAPAEPATTAESAADAVRAKFDDERKRVNKLKVADLRAELEDKELDTDGRKAELVARLLVAMDGAEATALAAAELADSEPAPMEVDSSQPPAPASSSAAAEDDSTATGAGGGGGGGGTGQRGTKRKKRDDDEPTSQGFDDGLSLLAEKAIGAVTAAKNDPPPDRVPAQDGSPILQVHEYFNLVRGYERVNDFKIVTDKNGGEVYNASLIQVNLRQDLNRFYSIQLLQKKGHRNDFRLFIAHGKVGISWQQEIGMRVKDPWIMHHHSSKQAGINAFKGWFMKKTGNAWDNRHNFVQRPEMYDLVELSPVNSEGRGAVAAAAATGAASEPTISKAVADLVQMLFDEDTILNDMKEQGVNLEKFPLGEVTVERIQLGHDILEQIVTLLDNPPPDDAPAEDKLVWRSIVEKCSTDLHQKVPRADPTAIDSHAKVKETGALLNMLHDIAIGQSLLRQGAGTTTSSSSSLSAAAAPKHPIDEQYEKLNCEIVALDHGDPIFEHIKDALHNTSRTAHRPGFLNGFRSSKLKLVDVFTLDRRGDAEKFQPYHESIHENRKLLWHGSNVAACAAITSTGLRIMPSAGGRAGKGLYFGREANKSGYYITTAPDGHAIMFLAEVAVGKPLPITQDSYTAQSRKKAPPGHESVHCVGVSCPCASGDVRITMPDTGVQAVLSTGKPTLHPSADRAHPDSMSSFAQDEFIVYKEGQARLRYMLRIKLGSK